MYGSVSLPFMCAAAQTLSETIPGAELREVEGQDHNVAPAALAPIRAAFLTD
jgi:hypothetical protein